MSKTTIRSVGPLGLAASKWLSYIKEEVELFESDYCHADPSQFT